MKSLLYLTSVLLFSLTTYAQDCNLSEDARRYLVRANIAIKEAKNDADYLDAATEFKKALQYAPDCPDIYYNIGMCYERITGSEVFKDITSYGKAIEYFKKYLELKPYASDKQSIQNKIYELEYRYDKLCEQIKAFEPEMIFVEGGTFQMGCTNEQGRDCEKDEKPVHQVTVSGFYIGKYEITQKQWKAIMGNNPSAFAKGDNYPIENVNWFDVQEFISRLNAATGKQYRLPTEAEWEFAARGGNNGNSTKNIGNKFSGSMSNISGAVINENKNTGNKYSGSNKVDNVAWYNENSGKTTHAVGTKSPNELGIYDMSGNVWEWCNDWLGDYSNNMQINPQGTSSSSKRVFRGGSWNSNANYVRVSYRGANTPNARFYNIGFRLVFDSK